MFKQIHKLVWAFDAEWMPNPTAGRLLYDLPEDADDQEVMEAMWLKGGATEENPRPFLKTILCRMLSIAAVQRHQHADGKVTLTLLSLPRDPNAPHDEKEMVWRFLNAIGERHPQLVGYNSLAADLRILVQRGICLGIQAPRFALRPNKPWEGVDYFAKGSDWHIDLRDYATPGWGSGTPSLHELAVLSGIPGKMDASGEDVPRMWLEGQLDRIIAYNERDALTTYLVWLRMAHFGGLFNPETYLLEQQRLREMIVAESAHKPHLHAYLAAWERLSPELFRAEG
ncbi:MAG: 3'-5' exonuclease [Magnetococcales bacterium]|nr:3'-5' exonuclease [Magnetococcales bacterium]